MQSKQILISDTSLGLLSQFHQYPKNHQYCTALVAPPPSPRREDAGIYPTCVGSGKQRLHSPACQCWDFVILPDCPPPGEMMVMISNLHILQDTAGKIDEIGKKRIIKQFRKSPTRRHQVNKNNNNLLHQPTTICKVESSI